MFILQMFKTIAKFCEKSRNKQHSYGFQWCPLSRPCLYWYHFLLFPLHESGTRKGVCKIFIQSMQFDCSNRTSVGYSCLPWLGIRQFWLKVRIVSHIKISLQRIVLITMWQTQKEPDSILRFDCDILIFERIMSSHFFSSYFEEINTI